MLSSVSRRSFLKATRRSCGCWSSCPKTPAVHRATTRTRTMASTATPAFGEKVNASWDIKDMVDLQGKTFLVTGGNAGIGYEAAKALAAHNAHVVFTARDEDKGEQAKKDITAVASPNSKVDMMLLDLSSLESVKQFAEEFGKKKLPLNALINNAGVFLVPHEMTKDGFEVTQAVNVFGPYYLTHLLLDKLKQSAPSRIVWLGSVAENFGTVDWQDLKGAKDDASDLNMYGRTKLFNIMLGREFNRRLKAQGTSVESYAAQPGIASTPLYDKMDHDKLSAKAMHAMEGLIGQSEERGALSMLYAATAPELEGKGGTYYGPSMLIPNTWNTGERKANNPLANDDEACRRLYDELADILQEVTGKPLPNRM